MAVTIRTRYVGPRGLTGSRIRATGRGRQVTIPYPHHLGMGEAAHRAAAFGLLDVLNLPGTLTTFATDNPARYVHTVAGA